MPAIRAGRLLPASQQALVARIINELFTGNVVSILARDVIFGSSSATLWGLASTVAPFSAPSASIFPVS